MPPMGQRPIPPSQSRSEGGFYMVDTRGSRQREQGGCDLTQVLFFRVQNKGHDIGFWGVKSGWEAPTLRRRDSKREDVPSECFRKTNKARLTSASRAVVKRYSYLISLYFTSIILRVKVPPPVSSRAINMPLRRLPRCQRAPPRRPAR